MKTRNGFVSNSSSSSFTCPICDKTYDVQQDGDPNIGWCPNDHKFCLSHIDEKDLDKITKNILSIRENKSVVSVLDKEICDISYSYLTNIVEAEEWDFNNDIIFHIYSILKDIAGSVPENLCPFCKLEKIMGKDLLDFVKKDKKLMESIQKNISERFGSYKKFKKYIGRKNED